jgi:hypothetical protein
LASVHDGFRSSYNWKLLSGIGRDLAGVIQILGCVGFPVLVLVRACQQGMTSSTTSSTFSGRSGNLRPTAGFAVDVEDVMFISNPSPSTCCSLDAVKRGYTSQQLLNILSNRRVSVVCPIHHDNVLCHHDMGAFCHAACLYQIDLLELSR